MTNYNIKSSTLNRLVNVCSFFEHSALEEIKVKINTVRLENRKGKSFAIVSNGKIGAIEYVGETTEQDGAVHLILSESLMLQATLEAGSDHSMTLNTIPEIAISTLESTSGYMISDACYWWQDTPLKDWAGWGVQPANSSSGIMYWNLNQVELLVKSSPSSKVIFPRYIDVRIPLLLRDYHNTNWVGMFFPAAPDHVEITTPAQLPDWWSV